MIKNRFGSTLPDGETSTLAGISAEPMKIISFLNVTNLHRIACDSGYIFQRLVAPLIVEAGHQFTFASPVSIEGIAGPRFRHVPFSFGGQKFEVRYSFPWPKIEQLLVKEAPDVIWVNQPELAASFRAVLASLGSSARIVSYVHYFPYGLLPDGSTITPDPAVHIKQFEDLVLLKFLSGILASDLVLTHSAYAVKLLQAGLAAYSLSTRARIGIIPPPFDPALIPAHSTPFASRNLLIYNHRLYSQYGTEKLINYLQAGLAIDGHEVVVLDILGVRSQERRRLDPSVEMFRHALANIPGVRIDIGGNNRAYYGSVLAQSKLAMAPFRPSCPWSMSVVDCLAAGLPVAAQAQAFFPEIMPAKCLHDGSCEQFKDLCRQLCHDEILWHECSAAGRAAVAHLTPQNIAARLIEAFAADGQALKEHSHLRHGIGTI